jgi:hypothetical protein
MGENQERHRAVVERMRENRQVSERELANRALTLGLQPHIYG